MLRSLSGFVQQTIGRKIVIEFKDESSAEGFIEACDESMNITLTEVKYFKRRLAKTSSPVELDTFFARGNYIRFVHFQFRDTDRVKSLINRTAKVEEKPRTHLSESLKKYEPIYPRIRSLNSTISPYSMHFSFKAFNQTFILILRESDRIPSASTNFRLIDAFDKDKSDQLLSSFTYYEGFLSECPHATVSLTISKTNDEIMGRIDTDNETFYIEKLSNETIIYRASDVKLDLSAFGPKGHSLFVPECAAKRHQFEELIRSKRAISRKPVKRNRCEMKLVADYEFYKVIGNNNYYSAANYLINVIERVNKIFTSVDWGINGYGDKLTNIGFLIKEIKIYNYPTPKGHYFHFNNEYARSGSNIFSVTDLMMSFSEEEGSNASCVTVLVTAKVMEGGILGLAHVGNTQASLGICANKPHNDFYSNTAVVTVMKKEGLMITRIFDLAFTHELGHLFGATHDTEECGERNERFIMHETANTGYDKNNYRFSTCTINEVFKVLYNVQQRCFVEEQKSLCGNGILEPGEECDGGGRFVAEQMGESAGTADPCCTSECKLRPNALCSPKHAECCSAACDYRQADSMCQPRNNETCRAASYCTGNSSVCPVQDNVEEGTGCSDEGKCMLGKCISFCETLNNESRPCTCENVKDSCYRCCKQGELGKCLPITPYRYLKEGSICILGHCRQNICEKEVTDVATHFWRLFKDINETPKSKLFGDYLVFVVVIIITVIWIPCAFLVHRRDKKGKVIPANEMTIISAPVHFGSSHSSNGTAA
uniref:Uncharacterized protein n=1 Tax=Panagrolaimus sp. ES5 TaxID=591445 RepID=A0AC34FBR8_9BILA